MADDTLSGRIAGILDRLTAISRMTPGMPLRAEDWNTVIGAVIDLARLQGTQAATSPGHSHPGQVSREWLDGPLGEFVDGTRATQLATNEQLRLLSARVDRMEARLTALSEQVGTLQSTVDSQADGGLDRDITIKRVSDRVDTLDLLGSEVADVRTRLTRLDPQLQDAIKLRSELTGPEGVIPDLGRLQAQVDDLDLLRDNLRLADGSVGRLRDLERRLDTFEAIGTNEDVLASRVDAIVDVSIGQRGLVSREELVGTITNVIGPELEPVRTGLDAVTLNFGDLVQTVEGFKGEIEATRPRLDALESEVADTRGLRDAFGALEAWQRDADGKIGGLSDEVARVSGLADVVGAVDASLSELRQQVDRIQVGTVDLGPLQSELAVLDRRVLGIEEQSRSWVTMDLFQEVDATLNQALRDLRTLDASVNNLDRTFNDYRITTDARIDSLGGRTLALQDATSKLSLDLGSMNTRFDVLNRGGTVFRGGGPG
jgi:chromosome segregation ATPase